METRAIWRDDRHVDVDVFDPGHPESFVGDLPTPLPDADTVVDRAVTRAARWLSESERLRTRREKANRRRLTRLLRDPAGLPVTMALTDEVMRISEPSRAGATLRTAAASSNVRALGMRDHLGLTALRYVTPALPSTSMKLVHRPL